MDRLGRCLVLGLLCAGGPLSWTLTEAQATVPLTGTELDATRSGAVSMHAAQVGPISAGSASRRDTVSVALSTPSHCQLIREAV